MYFRILLLLHIIGAIYGFGPPAIFSVLHKMSEKFTGEGRRSALEALDAATKRSVIPFSIIQPLTGVLLIFELRLNQSFFDHEWLWIAILLYLVLFLILHARAIPTLRKMLKMELAGDANNPEFAGLSKRFGQTGAILGILLTVIVILMSTKPGGPPHY